MPNHQLDSDAESDSADFSGDEGNYMINRNKTTFPASSTNNKSCSASNNTRHNKNLKHMHTPPLTEIH